MKNTIQTHEVYEGYAMVHPDGTVMCYCDSKKAHWYINRHIARWIGEKKFQLLFAPNGYGKSHDPFYTQVRDNHCVVCGRKEALNKHHVVPYVFRKRFPIEYKSNNHHDVLSICVECHEAYETHATIYKKEMARRLNVAFDTALTEEDILNIKIKKARNLLKNYNAGVYTNQQGKAAVIPPDRIAYLQTLASQPITARDNQCFWADAIIANILKEGTLQEFIESWREHFIEFAKPQYLPNYWSIKHVETRS